MSFFSYRLVFRFLYIYYFTTLIAFDKPLESVNLKIIYEHVIYIM